VRESKKLLVIARYLKIKELLEGDYGVNVDGACKRVGMNPNSWRYFKRKANEYLKDYPSEITFKEAKEMYGKSIQIK